MLEQFLIRIKNNIHNTSYIIVTKVTEQSQFICYINCNITQLYFEPSQYVMLTHLRCFTDGTLLSVKTGFDLTIIYNS